MTPKWSVLAIVILLAPGAAAAQEAAAGAERIEIDTAIFGGGMFFMRSAVPSEAVSRSYVVSGAVTLNLNRWVGVEGDLGWAMSRGQAHNIYGVVPTGPRTPNALLYSGHVVVNPLASDHPVIPYITVGLGAVKTFALAGTSHFALAGDSTYLMGSTGGGVRWFPIRHWGVRGDYRFVRLRRDNEEPVVNQRIVHSAHRVYGAVVLTF